MELPAELRARLKTALTKAYPIESSFCTMVDDADLRDADGIRITFGMFWNNQPFLDALNSFLKALEGNGQLLQLCHTARRKCQRNQDLQRAVEQIERFLDPIRGFCPPADAAFESELEKIVLGGMQLVDAEQWVRKLKQCLAPICRVEPQPAEESLDGYGTGFLVAPQVVMTCAHVARVFAFDPARAKRARFRFDYHTTAAGQICAGPVVGLAPADWVIACGTSSEIDFALLHLDTALGDLPVEGVQRGLIEVARSQPQDREGHVIPQHPGGQPLKLAIGGVDLKRSNLRHVAYANNTLRGSSGSPCLNSALQAVAVHFRGHEGVANYGVRIGAILDWFKEPQRQKERTRLAEVGLGSWNTL